MNIYIESSVKGIKRKNGIVAYIIEKSEADTITQFGTVKEVTENQAELLALKHALNRIKTECGDILIYTENKYIFAAFEQKWIEKWKNNGFKSAKGEDIANKSEWEEVAKSLKDRMPKVFLNFQHSYKNWLKNEIEKRKEKLCTTGQK